MRTFKILKEDGRGGGERRGEEKGAVQVSQVEKKYLKGISRGKL